MQEPHQLAVWNEEEVPPPDEDLPAEPNPGNDPDPMGRRLLSGLLGLNVMLLGAAMILTEALNPLALLHQELQLFILMLMGLSVAWILWYLLWARKRPGIAPHKDHHAGGITVTAVLMIFSAFSLLLHFFHMGYSAIMAQCKPFAKALSPFLEAPFLALQTFLLWAHSKDCIHKHKILTRSGLMLIICTNLLLWMNTVADDTVHMEMEMERGHHAGLGLNKTKVGNATTCHCRASPPCLIFRKGFQILYPFSMEFYLMASCLLYVMWKNVGHRSNPHAGPSQRVTLRIVHHGGILAGPLAGVVVLLAGVVAFILYQVWVGYGAPRRIDAFLLFYGFHLAVIPLMALCSLVGMAVHQLEGRPHESGWNPTRSLDVLLLLGAALGQLGLSYLCLVAALAVGAKDLLGSLDLAYSILSLLELMFQNIFIIEGLHRHPNVTHAEGEQGITSSIFKRRNRSANMQMDDGPQIRSLLKGPKPRAPSGKPLDHSRTDLSRRILQEICSFLILANIMLWVIPAFGAHPQFENSLGKQFYGFRTWFILMNLGQPLAVFYRMHSVGALMELLVTA